MSDWSLYQAAEYLRFSSILIESSQTGEVFFRDRRCVLHTSQRIGVTRVTYKFGIVFIIYSPRHQTN